MPRSIKSRAKSSKSKLTDDNSQVYTKIGSQFKKATQKSFFYGTTASGYWICHSTNATGTPHVAFTSKGTSEVEDRYLLRQNIKLQGHAQGSEVTNCFLTKVEPHILTLFMSDGKYTQGSVTVMERSPASDLPHDSIRIEDQCTGAPALDLRPVGSLQEGSDITAISDVGKVRLFRKEYEDDNGILRDKDVWLQTASVKSNSKRSRVEYT